MLCTVRKSTEKSSCPYFTVRAARASFLFAGIFFFAALLVPQAGAQAAKTPQKCCVIKTINASTGIISAVDKTTGRAFEFSVKDQDLLNSVRVGQSVSANFKTSQVTIYGDAPCCEITSLGGVAKLEPVDGGVAKLEPVDGVVTGIDVSGLVTAQAKATGQMFQFRVSDASLLNSLRLGQSVSANFDTSQVTIYGSQPCCEITSPGATSAGGVASHAGTVPSAGNQQQSGQGSSAKARAPLATAESDLPGIRMELQELKRVGNSVNLKFSLFNDGAKEFELGYSFGGWDNISNIYMLDPLTNTKYAVMNGAGCLCSSNVPKIAAKSKAILWAKFAVPAEVKKVSVVVPRFVPLEDISISTEP